MSPWTLRMLGVGNASAVELGSAMATLLREYPGVLPKRSLLYHYESAEDGEALRARGWRVGVPGEVVALRAPLGATPK